MRIAILTFDGFNEIDSLVAMHILNRMRPHGWEAQIVGADESVTSMNGLIMRTQGSLESSADADVVLFGSGTGTRASARDPEILERIALDPNRQLVGAQCSGVLMMASLGLLDGIPACTDSVTKPWVIEAGVAVLDQPFVAIGSRATAGGCFASTYLAAWVIASACGRDRAAEVLRIVAPVGEVDHFVDHALDVIDPYLGVTLADANRHTPRTRVVPAAP